MFHYFPFSVCLSNFIQIFVLVTFQCTHHTTSNQVLNEFVCFFFRTLTLCNSCVFKSQGWNSERKTSTHRVSFVIKIKIDVDYVCHRFKDIKCVRCQYSLPFDVLIKVELSFDNLFMLVKWVFSIHILFGVISLPGNDFPCSWFFFIPLYIDISKLCNCLISKEWECFLRECSWNVTANIPDRWKNENSENTVTL